MPKFDVPFLLPKFGFGQHKFLGQFMIRNAMIGAAPPQITRSELQIFSLSAVWELIAVMRSRSLQSFWNIVWAEVNRDRL